MNSQQKLALHDHIRPGIRILFPESSDIRVLIAAITLSIEGIIQPVLIGDKDSMIKTLSSQSERERYKLDVMELTRQVSILETIETMPLDPSYQEDIISRYIEKKGGPRESAREKFPMDLAQATGLVKSGQVQGAVAGSIATTADVIRTGYYGIGLTPGSRISGEFFMIPGPRSIRDDIYTLGDSAVNPEPTASEIAGFADSLLRTHTLFRPGVKPRIAFLSFSTHGSGTGESVDKMSEATRLFQARFPEVESDGPLQFDAATNIDIYRQKTKGRGRLTDTANILVFPDLDSGNIIYKTLESHGGYEAIGPILTGYAFPWSDLSRGTSIQAIVDMAYVTARRSQNTSQE